MRFPPPSAKCLGVLAVTALIAACASSDPQLTRKGGPLPGVAGETDVSVGGAGSEPIKWCDALLVIQAKCQRCHQEPPKNGAPMHLLSYEDTQIQWTMTKLLYQDMADVVGRDIMPFVALNGPPTNLMPPVEPLTADEKATLLGWLNQGAKPEGGTDCP